MREILFRGKTINSEEWAEGNYLYDEFSETSVIVPYINLAGNVTDFSEHSAAAVITETVGQYTGLTDKNGNKIFEGDIVRLTFSEEVVGKIICDINYYFEVYLFGKTTHKSLSDYSPYDLEILGNIHDNPELLEVQNEQG